MPAIARRADLNCPTDPRSILITITSKSKCRRFSNVYISQFDSSTTFCRSDVRKRLVGIIRRVHNGEVVITPPMASKVLKEFGAYERMPDPKEGESQGILTKREIEVLEMVSAGYSNKRIAEALIISKNTVKGHLSNILGKLHANNRQQAVSRAIEKGILHI